MGERAQLMFASGRFIKGMDLPTSETVPSRYWTNYSLISVADPDPDPYVFWPPGSGSDSLDPSIIKQNSKKNLNSYCFVTSL